MYPTLPSLQLSYLGADKPIPLFLWEVGVGVETDRRKELAGGPKLLSLQSFTKSLKGAQREMQLLLYSTQFLRREINRKKVKELMC